MKKITTNKTLVLLGIFLALSIFPLPDLITINDYNKQRFSQVALIIVTIKYLLLHDNLSFFYKSISFIIFSLGLTSALLSQSLLTSTLNFTHIFLLCSIIGLGYKEEKNFTSILYLLFLANLIVISLSLLDYSFFIFNSNGSSFSDVHFRFSNVRFFNQFQIITIFSLFYALFNPHTKRLAFIFIFINFFLMLQTGARGAIISLFTVLSLSSLLTLNKEIKKILITIFNTFILSLCFFLIFNYLTNENQLNYTFRGSSSGRIELWLELLENLTFKSILIGNGPGTYQSDFFALSHPHNSFLQILINWGGISAILFTTLIIITNRYLLKKAKFMNTEVFFVFLAFNGLIFYSFFSGIIVMPLPQTFLFLFWGMLLSYISNNSNNRIINLNYKKIFLLAIIAFIFIVLVLLSKKCVGNLHYGPSYWNHGKISLLTCKISY